MKCVAMPIIIGCARADDWMRGFYFAYGSNMNPQRVAERGLRFESVCSAVLHGVALAFDKQSRAHPAGGHANLIYDRTAVVEGVLYEMKDADEIIQMDAFEAAPINYSRDVVVVSVAGVSVPAWTYFANAAVIRPGLRPERAYLAHLLAGRAFLSQGYFDRLSRIQCVDD